MKKFQLLDLFSGIGGFSLGLERSGYFETVAFCEIEPFPRKVLAKHWPEVPCYHDVRELTADRLAADGIAVDAICGGFPCQDISLAGTGSGLDGARSGLWTEIARLIGELRPRIVIVENVSALLSNGMGRVLGDMAALGYDSEWHCIQASRLGAPHDRDRVWIVANSDKIGRLLSGQRIDRQHVLHSGREWLATAPQKGWANVQRWISSISQDGNGAGTSSTDDRMVDGVPDRLDRIAALGNAVVPQIPELIGRAIGEAMKP